MPHVRSLLSTLYLRAAPPSPVEGDDPVSQEPADQSAHGLSYPCCFGKEKARCHKKKWLIVELEVTLSEEEIRSPDMGV